MAAEVAIGVFDSGLGGLTVLSALRRALPDQAFVYLGDNAHAPYGPRSSGDIFDLTIGATARLFEQGCELVILACNTASAVALRMMQECWVPADRRVLGVFVPVIERLAGRDWGDRSPPHAAEVSRVILFATEATVRSGAFPRELALRASGVEVAQVACPGLVDAIESGRVDAAEALIRAAAARGLARMADPQVAVLGCTHYPLKAEAFARCLPPGVRLISQAEIVADSLRDYLDRHPRFRAPGPTRYLTTGDPATVGAEASRLLGVELTFGRA